MNTSKLNRWMDALEHGDHLPHWIPMESLRQPDKPFENTRWEFDVGTFKQLDAFVALADAGTFEKAASRLHTTQSAVSRHISEFEADFERQLLDRSGRRALFTVDGADVLMLCRSILRQRDALLQALQKQVPPAQTLRIGVTEITALTWLHRFLDAMETEFPQITVEPHVEESTHLRELLGSGDLDAIVVPDSANMDGITKVRMGRVENRWYCSPKIHPGRTVLSTKDLGSFTLLTQGNRARSGILLDEWLRYNSITPRFIISSSSLMALLDLVVAGVGISYLPAVLVGEMLDSNRIREVSVRPHTQAVNYAMLLREDSVTDLHRNIIALARSNCDFTIRYKGAPPSGSDTLHNDLSDA